MLIFNIVCNYFTVPFGKPVLYLVFLQPQLSNFIDLHVIQALWKHNFILITFWCLNPILHNLDLLHLVSAMKPTNLRNHRYITFRRLYQTLIKYFLSKIPKRKDKEFYIRIDISDSTHFRSEK